MPTRRAAAALLALIMAAEQKGYEAENKHPTGPELRARRWRRFWKPPTTWGGGAGVGRRSTEARSSAEAPSALPDQRRLDRCSSHRSPPRARSSA